MSFTKLSLQYLRRHHPTHADAIFYKWCGTSTHNAAVEKGIENSTPKQIAQYEAELKEFCSGLINPDFDDEVVHTFNN